MFPCSKYHSVGPNLDTYYCNNLILGGFWLLEKWCGGAYLLWKSIGGDPKEKGSTREKKRGCLCAHCASYIGRCTVEDVFIINFSLGFRCGLISSKLSVGWRDLSQAQKWILLLPAEKIYKLFSLKWSWVKKGRECHLKIVVILRVDQLVTTVKQFLSFR